MLEQPVRVLQDGTIDDRYEFDTYDTMMYEADKVLLSPVEAGEKLLEARERYLYMENRAQGIAGFDYARIGMYGCKIDGTGCVERDALTDFAEAGERLQEAERKYKEEQEKCIKLLRECDRLTEEQRGALECRYCNDVKLTGYAVMSLCADLQDISKHITSVKEHMRFSRCGFVTEKYERITRDV